MEDIEAAHLRKIQRRLNYVRQLTNSDERVALYSEFRQKIIPVMKKLEEKVNEDNREQKS